MQNNKLQIMRNLAVSLCWMIGFCFVLLLLAQYAVGAGSSAHALPPISLPESPLAAPHVPTMPSPLKVVQPQQFYIPPTPTPFVTDALTTTLSSALVRGQVRFANDQPAEHVAIGVFATTDAGACSNSADDSFAGAVSAADGHYQIGNLPVSSKLCAQYVTMWDGKMAATVHFTIPDATRIVDLGVITAPAPIKRITGHVRSRGGQGIPSEISAGIKNGNTYMGTWLDTETDANGGFTVGVGPGVWEVRVHPTADDWVQLGAIYTETFQTVTFANDQHKQTQDLEFILTLPSAIAGRLLSPDGQPLIAKDGQSAISVSTTNQRDRTGNRAAIDNAGRFLLRVSPGANWVRFIVPNYGFPQDLNILSYPEYFPPPPRLIQVQLKELVDLGDIRLAGPQVVGRVVDVNSEPVAGVWFTAHRPLQKPCPPNPNVSPTPTHEPTGAKPFPGELPTPPPLNPASGYPWSDVQTGQTNEHGVLRLGGLRKGPYCLNIVSPEDEQPGVALSPISFRIEDVTTVINLGVVTLP